MKPSLLLCLLLLCVSAFAQAPADESASKFTRQSLGSNGREIFSAQADKPNILFILADDLGYADVGFNGSKDITTPALDHLAENGMIFASGYVAHPVCGPSRTALMTGRLPHRFGAQDNIPPGHPEFGITLSETFLSNVLRDSGYFTGMIGKWHLGSAPEYQPNQRGFDEFYGFLGSGHGYFVTRYELKFETEKKAGTAYSDSNAAPLLRNGVEVKENNYLTDGFTREAVRFIDSAAKKEQPFFLYLAYNAPHAPMEARKEDLEKFSHIADRKRRVYAAMVYAVDRGVAKIVETLQTTGQFDNTLILFFSDNGGAIPTGASNAPLKAGKRDVYEGGVRVPMMMHWPAQVKAGQRFEHPVTSLEFYPTLARLAGASIPAGKLLDGKDIWADVMAGRNPHTDEMIFAMSHRHGYTDASGRRGKWKAVKAYQRPWMLYNLERDIGETHNVSQQHPDMLKKWSATSRTGRTPTRCPCGCTTPRTRKTGKATPSPTLTTPSN
ncbi:MAG: sulfatase-like hydrolase/transferase [Verrucomicrobiales bacterium]|nr:sulfatase-like hydrolase/transferase [Verrucomicrobiales bacterium]